MSSGKVIAISGIDTDIGKSVVTGLMAKYLLDKGYSVITQKICQTGCLDISEDIVTHRKIMGVDLFDADREGLTCPYIFPEPCSPHLAARLGGEIIDPQKIKDATKELQLRYDIVLLEGVGGLMVPLSTDYLLIDYLSEGKYENILVSSPRLGSVNHTLSALELFHSRSMLVIGIIYNLFFQASPEIVKDSQNVFRSFLAKKGFAPNVVEVESLSSGKHVTADFSPLLG